MKIIIIIFIFFSLDLFAKNQLDEIKRQIEEKLNQKNIPPQRIGQFYLITANEFALQHNIPYALYSYQAALASAPQELKASVAVELAQFLYLNQKDQEHKKLINEYKPIFDSQGIKIGAEERAIFALQLYYVSGELFEDFCKKQIDYCHSIKNSSSLPHNIIWHDLGIMAKLKNYSQALKLTDQLVTNESNIMEKAVRDYFAGKVGQKMKYCQNELKKASSLSLSYSYSLHLCQLNELLDHKAKHSKQGWIRFDQKFQNSLPRIIALIVKSEMI